jgi:hypothetical protein
MKLLGKNKFVKFLSFLNFVKVNATRHIYILPKIVGLINDFFITSLPIKSSFFHWLLENSNYSVSRNRLRDKTIRNTLNTFFNFVELMP